MRWSLALLCSLVLFGPANVALSQRRSRGALPPTNYTLYFPVVNSPNLEMMAKAVAARARVKTGTRLVKASVIAMEMIEGRDMCDSTKEGLKDFSLWALSAERGSRLVVNRGERKAALLVVGEMTLYKPASDYCKSFEIRATKAERGSFFIGYPTTFHPSPRTFWAVPAAVPSSAPTIAAACEAFKNGIVPFHQSLRGRRADADSYAESFPALFLPVGGTRAAAPSPAPAGFSNREVQVVYPGIAHKRALTQELVAAGNGDGAQRVLENTYRDRPQPSDESMNAALMAATQTSFGLGPRGMGEAHLNFISQFIQAFSIFGDAQITLQTAQSIYNSVDREYSAIDSGHMSHLIMTACGRLSGPELTYGAHLYGPGVNVKLRGTSAAPNTPMAYATSSENVPPRYQELMDRELKKVEKRLGMSVRAATLTGEAASNEQFREGIPRFYVHYFVEVQDKGVDLTKEVRRGAEVILSPPAAAGRR